MKKKKGFTLIELVAVLVILAVLATIVTPLVLSIIKKSKVSADMRSVDAYGRSVEIAVATYLLETQEFPTSFDDITVEYRGSKVVCADVAVNMDGSIYINKCAVNGSLVRDSKSPTGYYQFGKDTGSYMFYHFENVSEHTNASTGTGSSNSGSTSVVTPGSQVTYGGVSYYVLSTSTDGNAVLIKSEPLSYDEILSYGTGISVTNVGGYGAIAYYTGDNCNNTDSSGCKTDYETSNVKIVIDAWAQNNSSNLKPGEQYSIMTIEELLKNGYVLSDGNYVITDNVDSNLYALGVSYWALDTNGNLVYSGSRTFRNVPVYDVAAVRPIIIVKTSSIRPKSSNNSGNSNNINPSGTTNSNKASNPYTVDNIIMYVAILVIVVCGIILVIYLLNKNKDNKNNKEDKK